MLAFMLILNCLIFETSIAKNNSGSYRIKGGQAADKKFWNFMAVISNGRRLICGGSLIKTSWVLTAAQCVHPEQQARVIDVFGPTGARLGTDDMKYVKEKELTLHDVQGMDDSVMASKVNNVQSVAKIYIHAGYKETASGLSPDDIALLKLSEPVELSENVNLVKLPSRSVQEAESCKAAGWGDREFQDEAEFNILQEVEFPLENRDNCMKTLEKMNADNGVSGKVEHKLCVLNDKSIFRGDSGGPLICSDTIHGISSAMGQTEDGRYLQMFTEVEGYRKWIDKIIEGNGEQPTELKDDKSACCTFFINYFVTLLCLIYFL